jgi:hypothetical protein
MISYLLKNTFPHLDLNLAQPILHISNWAHTRWKWYLQKRQKTKKNKTKNPKIIIVQVGLGERERESSCKVIRFFFAIYLDVDL